MSEVKRYELVEMGMTYHKAAEMLLAEDGLWVDYDDYAELKAQRDALAAENALLKSNLMFWDSEDPEAPYDYPEDIANNCAMEANTEFDVQVAAKMPNRTYRVSEAGEYDCTVELVSGGMPETPATDAYLNSVRAEGVESFAHHQRVIADSETDPTIQRGHRITACRAEDFAAQLRAGKDGE